jgi:hypothetical protein
MKTSLYLGTYGHKCRMTTNKIGVVNFALKKVPIHTLPTSLINKYIKVQPQLRFKWFSFQCFVRNALFNLQKT